MPTPKKSYCFTINNYSEDELSHLYGVLEIEARYAIVGKESGESRTPHLQGYVIFKKSYRFDTIKSRYLPRAHIEVAKGSVSDNFKYCSKDGDFREFGDKPSESRTRDQLAQRFVECAVKGPGGVLEFADEQPGTFYFSGHNLLRNYLGSQRPIDRPDVCAKWYWGSPGSGKSRRAHAEAPEAYIKEPRTKWWSGYMLEDSVIIDDFGPGGIDINHLLRWFDRYKCLVESKGGMLPLYATKFIVTSNFHPEKIFVFGGDPNPQLPALMRRLVIEEMN